MWYFVWFIGVTMAVLLSVMHALWFELQEVETTVSREGGPSPTGPFGRDSGQNISRT
ncbi:MAG: cytochrome bd-I oxidase subunit CydX [Leptospirales bacterium]